MKIDIPLPKPGALIRAGRQEFAKVARAQQIAVDKAAQGANAAVRQAIQGAGLGKLANASKFTSSLRKNRSFASSGAAGPVNQRNAYGVIYADRGDESRSGQALIQYSTGGSIRPKPGNQWLAFPSKAVKKIVGFGVNRSRLTPATWVSSGLERRLGKLHFRAINSQRAILFVTGVDTLKRNGLAVPRGKRRSKARVQQKAVTIFELRRETFRSKRFDPGPIARYWSDQVPSLIAAEIKGTS